MAKTAEVKEKPKQKKFQVMAFWGPTRPNLDMMHIFADYYEVEDDGKTVSFYCNEKKPSLIASVASWVSVEIVSEEK